MKKRRIILVLLTFLVSMTSFAQKTQSTGVVVDDFGDPVIGASVVQKGVPANTAVTNLDGEFTVSVDAGSTLVISYIGYVTQEVKAGTNLHIVLKEDSQTLSEVVVVGYGVQKKSVVTAAIAKVSADDLAGTAPVRVDNALKGLAAGVQVTSGSGQPGDAARVRVRGIGTVNNSNPLYIVDGMPIEGNLDYLNPSDIESIEVLKDAASGAVYGARAANGVILVTTKSGKLGKVSVNYNASFGWQNPWRRRGVLNATEYALLMNEGRINGSMQPLYDNPYAYGEGTDWQKAIINKNAPVMNHELSVSGATEKVNYYLSMGYYTQDGVVGGNVDRSNYRRMTLRSNTKYTLFDATKERDWLNKLEITSNLSFGRTKQISINGNAMSNAVLNSALTLTPMLPIVYSGAEADAKLAEYQSTTNGYQPMYDKNGNLYSIPGADYDNQYNPVAYLSMPAAWQWANKFMGNFAFDLSLGYGFKFRTSYGADLTYTGVDNDRTTKFYMNSGWSNGTTSASAWYSRYSVWQVENVITWDKQFDKHTFNVVLGQSAKEQKAYGLSGSRKYLPDDLQPYIDNATGTEKGDVSVGGGPNDDFHATLASLFGRLSYNYDERYMFQATVRRDGSSHFGPNNHWATFPSFSLGWNLTNEKFMESTKNWLHNAKVRLSWGKNGNEAIGAYAYAAYTAKNYNVLFGNGDGTEHLGTKIDRLANPDLKWEESVQTDLGIDLAFLGGALTFTTDYFKKTTDGMLMLMSIPGYAGENRPWGNVGKMQNSGIEFELGYKFNVSDAKFQVKANASYLKNKLIRLGNETGEQGYDTMMGTGTISYAKNGQPFPYFYGYKTAGVFQNQAQVDEFLAKYTDKVHTAGVQPGDVIFVDRNGDGIIDGEDQGKIGKGTPDWTFGLNFNAEWKGFDFSMFWQGTAGNDIFDATLNNNRTGLNLPKWMLGRWTGEGTSNKYPRFVYGNTTNWVSSDLYVYDGSYLRLKNIQLGYSLPQSLIRKAFVNRVRVYVSAENLLTFTKYHGYDPEMVPASGTSVGIDYGSYPQSRTWTIGLNLGF